MASYQGLQLTITGRVQGVGFRPFIWQLAKRFGFTGKVYNNSAGVVVEILHKKPLASAPMLAFKQAISNELPPLAIIDTITETSISRNCCPTSFAIINSTAGIMNTQISPDMATCQACLDELFSKSNRRYQYPFINCTHCGPRLSIIKKMPYDRAFTAMHDFPLCPACLQEYQDPNDRRFHAQPNACPSCGPNIWLSDVSGTVINEHRVISAVSALLKQGKIIAIKGIGGFHLVCDASNEQAVALLRLRKNRPSKPFAIMVNEQQLDQYVHCQPAELTMLKSPQAPMVLLAKQQSNRLAAALAPQQLSYGVMLPANPLQHLIMNDYQQPLVMTSGNASGLPPCIDNQQALTELAGIADIFLLHNRDIINRLDDSIMRLLPFQLNGRRPWQVLRRARGLVPEPIKVTHHDKPGKSILALGADLKNSFCLLKNNQAIVGQHLGDLDKLEVFNEYQRQINRYRQLYDLPADIIAYDQHPDYHSNRVLADFPLAKRVAVQHHHAHAVSVLGEHQIPFDDDKAIALILDGLGFSANDNDAEHNLWGGELLLVSYHNYQHLWGLPSVAMPGGNIASTQPWRNLVAQISRFAPQHFANTSQNFAGLSNQDVALTRQMLDKNVNCPKSSSMGRLFDAVAALLLIAPKQLSYEGEAAIALENFAWRYVGKKSLCIDKSSRFYELGWQSATLWQSLLADQQQGLSTANIAFNFHFRIACMLSNEILSAVSEHKLNKIIFSGGVCQNSLLLSLFIELLGQKTALNTELNLQFLLAEQLPANDGGLALGQALIASRAMAQT